METLRPHDGKRTKRAPLNFNFYNYKPGERVLVESGGIWVGTLDRVDHNTAVIGNTYFDVRAIKARVPAGTDEAALVEQLNANDSELGQRLREAREAHERGREAILERHGIQHPGDICDD